MGVTTDGPDDGDVRDLARELKRRAAVGWCMGGPVQGGWARLVEEDRS